MLTVLSLRLHDLFAVMNLALMYLTAHLDSSKKSTDDEKQSQADHEPISQVRIVLNYDIGHGPILEQLELSP